MRKSKTTGDLILVIALGWLGVHKFKEKKIGMGFLYMCTFGLFYFGWLYDIYQTAKACGIFKKMAGAIKSAKKPEPKIEAVEPVAYIDSGLSPIDQEFARIDAMSTDGWQFEQYCADVLQKIGYANVKVTSGSGDYGIDILAEHDGVTYAIQCKCYSHPVGNKAVQEAFSGKEFYKRMVGVVMTNSTFTQAAVKTATETRVLLWDRTKLREMILTAKPELKQIPETINQL